MVATVAPRSLIDCLVEQSPRPDALVCAASDVLADHYTTTAEYRAVAVALETLISANPALSTQVEEVRSVVTSAIGDALRTATLYGVALARTWPDSPDGLDRWVDRALERLDRG